ncbi:hypothetical protein V2I01_24220 [Micromonospora sp. BRA006-A]|nr:hypothetical protein [Micromonospora sp. BRA006-A]
MRHGESADEPAAVPPRRPPGPRRGWRCSAAWCCSWSPPPPGRCDGPSRSGCPPAGAAFVVLPDRVVVADGPGAIGRGGRVVAAYRLPGGEPAWRFALTDGDHVLGLTAVAGDCW